MKKTLLLLLPILLLSCLKDKVEDELPSYSSYSMPKKGDISVASFTQSDPKYRQEGDYLYFDDVKFESEDIKGFTKIDHNTFKANETKEYKLDINLFGSVYSTTSSNFSFRSYYLIIKIDNLIHDEIKSSTFNGEGNPDKELTIKLNQGDIISFHFCSLIIKGYVVKLIHNTSLEISFKELLNEEADLSDTK